MSEKEKIITFSKDTFFKNGFYKITMDEIASALRISKKTIYKHFPSKGFLIESVLEILQRNVKSKITDILNSNSNSIVKIKALTQIFAELSLKLNQKFLHDIQSHRPDLWIKIENFRGKIIRSFWSEIIDQGKEEKYIVDKPNDIIIAIIYASIREVINPEFLLTHNYSINNAFGIAFDIIISGILTEKGKEEYQKSILENKDEN